MLGGHGPFAGTKQGSRLGTWPVLALGLVNGKLGSAGQSIAKGFSTHEKEMAAASEILKILSSIEAVHSPEIVIDSSHRAAQMILMREILGKEMKVIWLVRDRRAVAASLQRRQGFSIEKGARVWKRFNQLSQLLHKKCFSDRDVLLVQYEDLLESTADTLLHLGAFLGFDRQHFDSNMLSISPEELHFFGGSPSVDRQSSQDIKLDDRWRTQVSQDDLVRFERIAGDYNRPLRYAVKA